MLNVRLATPADRDEVLRLVNGLLTELGGTARPAEAASPVFDELASDGGAGFIVIAEEDGTAKAACTASFVQAIRTVGAVRHPPGNVRRAGLAQFWSGKGRY